MSYLVTHNHKFSCSEVCAIAIIKCLDIIPNMTHKSILRSKNTCFVSETTNPVVIGIGGEYLPEKNIFDVPREGKESFDESYNNSLGICGLVYKYYGKDLIQKVINETKTDYIFGQSDIDKLHLLLYSKLIIGLDSGKSDCLPKMIDIMSTTYLKQYYDGFWDAVCISETIIKKVIFNAICNHDLFVTNTNTNTNTIDSDSSILILDNSQVIRHLNYLDPECVVKYIVFPYNSNIWNVITRPESDVTLIQKYDTELQSKITYSSPNHIKIKSLNDATAIAELSLIDYNSTSGRIKRNLAKVSNYVISNKKSFLDIGIGILIGAGIIMSRRR